MLVAAPHGATEGRAPAGVIELVGEANHGYDFRFRIHRARHCDGTTDRYIACTDHFRGESSASDVCGRSAVLKKALARRTAAEDPLDVNAARRLLARVQMPCAGLEDWRTQQSVVFEPNMRRMHLAVSSEDKPAPQCTWVALDVREMLTIE